MLAAEMEEYMEAEGVGMYSSHRIARRFGAFHKGENATKRSSAQLFSPVNRTSSNRGSIMLRPSEMSHKALLTWRFAVRDLQRDISGRE